jgi:lipopolysaccharide/colanic/teichoic acid biosynthesis glycosyltransferase
MQPDQESPGRRPRGFYPAAGKRILDTLLAGGAVVAFAPFWLLLAFLVRVKMGAPVLFRQERPGLGGKPFTLLKFRSMNQARDADGRLLPDEQRLDRFGRFLRASSLDELPELLNVVRGDMALVGPRPLLMHYLDLYTPVQARRHEVRPGISGWAQISGRNFITISRRVELDVWYVDHLSFWLDLRILLLTIPRVLSSRGVVVAERLESMDLGRPEGPSGPDPAGPDRPKGLCGPGNAVSGR